MIKHAAWLKGNVTGSAKASSRHSCVYLTTNQLFKNKTNKQNPRKCTKLYTRLCLDDFSFVCVPANYKILKYIPRILTRRGLGKGQNEDCTQLSKISVA